MLMSPAILALAVGSMLACGVTVVAAVAGLSAASRWDPDDGSARQLARERRLPWSGLMLQCARRQQLFAWTPRPWC